MKFKFTLLFFIISSLLFGGEVVFDYDFVEFIYTLHNTLLDQCLSVAVFAVLGLVIDYIVGIKKKKEQEKVEAYNATMRATNQLLRDLMNNMIILSASESVQKEFGDDITGIMKNNIHQIEEVLESLTGLEEITPEMIRAISESVGE